MLIVFDNIIADMEANKKLSPMVTELLLRGRKINVSIVSISQSYIKLSPIVTELFYKEEKLVFSLFL